MRTDPLVRLELKKCDLSFVVGFEVKEPVALNAAPCDAPHLINRQHGMFPRRLSVVPKVVVSRRNEESGYDHELTNSELRRFEHWKSVLFIRSCKLKMHLSERFTVKNNRRLNHQENVPAISGVVLAGGRSTRMGTDKSKLEVEGIQLWERQTRLLEAVGAGEVVVSGSVVGPWAGSRYRAMEDVLSNVGPVAGIFTAIKCLRADFIVVLAVDMPGMDSIFLTRLLDVARKRGVGVVPRMNDCWEPLAAVYTPALLPLLEERIDARKFELQGFIDEGVKRGFLVAVECPMSEAESRFLNTNTWDEWQNYLVGG